MIILGFNVGSINIISLSLFSLGYFILNPLLALSRTGFSIELLCNILGHQMSINWKIGCLLHDK